MKRIMQFGIVLGIMSLMLGSSCDNFDSSNTITGVWRNRESYSNNNFRTYNVSVERYDVIDTSTYIIYNMYNLGFEFETLVQLKDSTFTILGSNNGVSSISGKGTFHKKSFTIDWEYSVSGDAYDPAVFAHFEKP